MAFVCVEVRLLPLIKSVVAWEGSWWNYCDVGGYKLKSGYWRSFDNFSNCLAECEFLVSILVCALYKTGERETHTVKLLDVKSRSLYIYILYACISCVCVFVWGLMLKTTLCEKCSL